MYVSVPGPACLMRLPLLSSRHDMFRFDVSVPDDPPGLLLGILNHLGRLILRPASFFAGVVEDLLRLLTGNLGPVGELFGERRHLIDPHQASSPGVVAASCAPSFSSVFFTPAMLHQHGQPTGGIAVPPGHRPGLAARSGHRARLAGRPATGRHPHHRHRPGLAARSGHRARLAARPATGRHIRRRHQRGPAVPGQPRPSHRARPADRPAAAGILIAAIGPGPQPGQLPVGILVVIVEPGHDTIQGS